MSEQRESLVFRPASHGEWSKNATVGWYPPDHDAYAESFLDAAEIIARHAVEKRQTNRLIFPVCFMFRHAIEVSLKEQILRADEVLEGMEWLGASPSCVGAFKKLESTHNLELLFNALKARLDAICPGAKIPAEVVDAIAELHTRDASGEAFRYARRKGTGRLVFEEQEHFDMERLTESLGEVVRFLSRCVGSDLRHRLDMISDHLGYLSDAAEAL